MAQAPNHQKLVVTQKNLPVSSGNYAKDMRTIEMWANEGIVRKIIAGTNVTTDPTDGVDMGQGVTVNSTGGGGASVDGLLETTLFPEDSFLPFNVISLGPMNPIFTSGSDGGQVWNLPNNAHGNVPAFTFGNSWFFTASAGISVCLLPSFTFPVWSGSDMGLNVMMAATDLTQTNYALWEATYTTITSGDSFQSAAADFSLVNSNGIDLTMTAGSGFSANGLVTTAGGIYIGSIWGNVGIPSDVEYS